LRGAENGIDFGGCGVEFGKKYAQNETLSKKATKVLQIISGIADDILLGGRWTGKKKNSPSGWWNAVGGRGAVPVGLGE